MLVKTGEPAQNKDKPLSSLCNGRRYSDPCNVVFFRDGAHKTAIVIVTRITIVTTITACPTVSRDNLFHQYSWLIRGEVVMNQIQGMNMAMHERSNIPALRDQECGIELDIYQSGLYETDPQEWSLTKLQHWIKEAEHLVLEMKPSRDSEIVKLRVLVQTALDIKKDLLTQLWTQCVH